jgi:Flp pilus assembly protein TadG
MQPSSTAASQIDTWETVVKLRGFDDAAARDRGAVAVEFALLVPLLAAMIFGLIDFGRAYNQQITLTQIAREGARLASLNIVDYKARMLSTVPASWTGTVTIGGSALCTVNSTASTDVTVTVTKQFSFSLPVGTTLTLTGKATMPCLG